MPPKRFSRFKYLQLDWQRIQRLDRRADEKEITYALGGGSRGFDPDQKLFELASECGQLVPRVPAPPYLDFSDDLLA